jgi:tetratricopeptide (TPR) repeat protein
VESSLAAWAANQTFGTISMVEDHTLRTRRGKLFAEYIKRRAAKGDLTALKETMIQVAGASVSQRNSYYVREAARPLLTVWQNESPSLIVSPDSAVRKAARDIWREFAFVQDPQNVLESAGPARVLRSLLYDAMDDSTADFSNAVADLPDAARKKAVKEIEGATVDSLEGLKFRWPDDKAEAEKVKSRTVLRMMQNTAAWPFETGGYPRTLRTLIERHWLRSEDVLAQAPALMERHPRDGRTAQELAVLQADAGKPAEALSLLDKAASQMPKEARAARTRLALTRSEVLERLERMDEALAVLNAIPEEEFDATKEGSVLKSQVLLARNRIGQGVAWRSGGAPAVVALVAKTIAAEPESPESRKAVANAYTLIADKFEAAGNKTGALRCREAAFLISERIFSGSPKNAESLARATKALREAREATGDDTVAVEAVPRNGVWRYFEGIQNFKSWMGPDYDDSAWKSGPGPLGTGIAEGNLRTKIGTIPEVMAFRTKFSLKNPESVHSITLELMRGDGVAIFLNGKQIQTNNLPEEEVTESIRAKDMVSDTEALQWRTLKISRQALGSLKKDNVLSVVLYQHDGNSTGLVFGLSATINDLEPWELAESIDKPAMEKALGELWTGLPEAFRKKALK